MTKSNDHTLIGIKPKTERFLNIMWVTSNLCNYRCNYCAENNYGGSHINTSEMHIWNSKKLIDDICEQYPSKGYKWLRVYFGGGEPTYWKPFNEILEYTRTVFDKSNFKQLSIGLNTNLSNSLEWWKENWHYFDHMSASFHIEFADQDKFIDNLKFLQDKFRWTVRLMMHDTRFQEVLDFGERIKHDLDNYNIEYVPLLTELSNRGVPHVYSDQWKQSFFKTTEANGHFVLLNDLKNPPKQFSLNGVYDTESGIEEHGFSTSETVRYNKNHFSGWTCHVEDLISIMHNGEVSDVTCGQGHILGNLNENEINLKKATSVLCNKELCHCGTEIALPKFKGPSPLLKP